MARYGAKFTHATMAAAFKTTGHLRAPASSMRRLKLADFSIGAGGTPADNATEFNLVRTTANGTDGSTVTPNPIDPADAACVATFGQGVTAEPTTAGVDLWDLPLNQRASYRWQAVPGYELVIPATANAGLAMRGLSPAYTGAFGGSLFFDE